MKGGNFLNGVARDMLGYARIGDIFEGVCERELVREREKGCLICKVPSIIGGVCGSFVVYQQGQIVVGLFTISLCFSLSWKMKKKETLEKIGKVLCGLCGLFDDDGSITSIFSRLFLLVIHKSKL